MAECVTLNDINSRSVKFDPAAIDTNSLWKTQQWRKQSKNKTQTNLENFFLRETLVDKSSWQHYTYEAGECEWHTNIIFLKQFIFKTISKIHTTIHPRKTNFLEIFEETLTNNHNTKRICEKIEIPNTILVVTTTTAITFYFILSH